MKEYNADLTAYLTLSELSKNENNERSVEDMVSKMRVHAGKMKGGFSFKW